ncbi:MAG: hypothetical protein ABSF18_00735 [Gammaproteobacteria bacterium]|jgi:hypothetical protein
MLTITKVAKPEAQALKYKPMPETGDCAVSPVISENNEIATGYYTGNSLATFTTEALIPRLQKSKAVINNPKPAEFNFHVAGRFHALNRWSLLKISSSQPNHSTKKNKKLEQGEPIYKFILLPQMSGVEARQLGDKIANIWASQNRTSLGYGAEEALRMTGQLQETVSRRHIKIISPNNIDLYAKFYKPLLEDGETALIVNIRHIHELFKTNPQQAAEYFAKLTAYYRHGLTLIQAQSENIDKLLKDTGLTIASLNDLNVKIGVASMPVLSQEAVNFLIDDLEINAEEFTRQLERYENQLKNPDSADKKIEQDKLAIFVYAKVFLSVDVFFGKKIIPFIGTIKNEGIIVNPEETELSKIKKISDIGRITELICQDYHAKTLFVFADIVGFCFFPNNDILYACPAAMDEMQQQMTDLIVRLFSIKIKFPVEYAENRVHEHSTREEGGNSSGSSSVTSQTSNPITSVIITSTINQSEKTQIDHAAMLEDFKSLVYDAMLQTCSPIGFYNIYLTLGMLNKIVNFYKIAITALSKPETNIKMEELLSIDKSFWQSIKKIAKQFKRQNYSSTNDSNSDAAQWLDKVISTAAVHLDDKSKYAQAIVFANTTSMEAWARHIKKQGYVNISEDVQFMTADNVPYERNVAFENKVAQAHTQFAYLSIIEEHRKHATTLSALESITDLFGSLLETSAPLSTAKSAPTQKK